MAIALIVLAAGKGTRMNSDLPKVLHPLGGVPLLHHAMRSGAALEPERVIVVTGHGAEAVGAEARAYAPEATAVLQEQQLGTGHAVLQCRAALEGFEGTVVVLYGDTPFVQPETLERLREAAEGHAVAVLGFETDEPTGYGRLVMQDGALERIVEERDATDQERAITFCNSGILCAPAPLIFELLDTIGNDNASGEYYLTDLPAAARARGLSATAIPCPKSETLGINTRAELAEAEEIFQSAMRAAALEDGVTLQAPGTVYFAPDTVIGRDAVIEPYVVFGPGVTVETGARVRAFSHLEGAHVSRGAIAGPYARLRPGAELAEDVRVGNFVEIKNAQIDAGAKVNHLTYVGDADIGKGANVGAGTVTCNYDGVLKHRTIIGPGAFIGSGSMLVAPVEIGADALTASGSVITEDVPEGALALARARQVNKPGMARKLREILLARKAARANSKKDG